jgi:glutathione peroxidase
MTKWSTMLLAGAVAACVSTSFAEEKKVPAALNFKMKAIDGKEVDLAKKYDGKVVLLVNVASKCGLTPQYEELESLHEKYANKGLAVVGVPCNQFGKQEPGTNEEIVEFCKSTYNVKFDLLSKVDVNEDTACPLYKYLTSLDTKPTGPGKISWNFEKFVIGKNGQVVARFAPRTAPDAPEVIKAIEDELAKK